MRIGLLHLAEKSWGGVYQYSLGVIGALVENDRANEYVVLNLSADAASLPERGEVIRPRGQALWGKALHNLYNALLETSPLPLPLLIPFPLTQLGRWRRRHDIQLDLLVSPVPALHLDKLNVPYIMVIHDVMHRFNTGERQSRWPERVYRDAVYRRGARGSVLTVVFTDEGKEELHRFYDIRLEKIRVMPCVPPPYFYHYKDMTEAQVDLALAKFNLPDRYIFYPAHFWLHKNHASLIRALYLIKQGQGVEIPLVLVGFQKEAFKEVMALVARLGLAGQVFYLGYVTEEEMVALYKKAQALVIPTLFELNSLPIVEALVLGTCCVSSNSFSLPEQVGDAALLFDPHNPEDIADKVWRVWTDPALRLELIERGRRLLEERYTPQVFDRQWLEVITEAAELCQSHRRS